MQNFVITGCARSGTGYMATLLSQLGVTTDHEEVFSPFATGFSGWGAATGESSWLAAPFLDQLPEGTPVFHQVRDPHAVITSLLGLRFFDTEGSASGRDLRSVIQVARARGVREIGRRLRTGAGRSRAKRRRSDFVDFALAHCPSIASEVTELDRAMAYWVGWNELIEQRAAATDVDYVRYRLEDIDHAFLADACERLGLDVDDAAITAALAATPGDFNTRPHANRSDGLALGPAVLALADRYGYGDGGSIQEVLT